MESKKNKRLINLDVLKRRYLVTYYYIRPFVYLTFLALSLILLNKYVINAGSINHDLIIKYSATYQWLLVIAFVYFLLRPYFPEIVSRIEEIWGIKLRPQAPVQPETDGELKDVADKASESSKEMDLTTLKGRAELIEDNFQIRWLLEKTYRFAYGTQLTVLSLLVSRGFMNLSEVNTYYEKHKTLAVVPHPNIQVWLQYLVNNGLVEQKEDQVMLTNVGRLFYEYLSAEGISDPNLKPY